MCPSTVSQSAIAPEQVDARASGPLYLPRMVFPQAAPWQSPWAHSGLPSESIFPARPFLVILTTALSFSPAHSNPPLEIPSRPFRLFYISSRHLTDMVYISSCQFVCCLSPLVESNLCMLCSLLYSPALRRVPGTKSSSINNFWMNKSMNASRILCDEKEHLNIYFYLFILWKMYIMFTTC